MDFSSLNHAHLKQESRTFEPTIALLPLKEREWVSVAYLICRVLDSIEDAKLPLKTRKEGLQLAHQALTEGNNTFEAFLSFIDERHVSKSELKLITESHKLLKQLGTFPKEVQESITKWTTQMVKGMIRYLNKPLLKDSSELED